MLIGGKILFALFALLMILPSAITLKANHVYYDDEFVYVRKWRKEKRFKISSIKSINEGYFWGLDPLFELEIEVTKNDIVKLDFFPRYGEQLVYFFNKHYSGCLLDLKQKIMYSKSFKNVE